VFVAAQKLVSFNLGHYADVAGLVSFGAFNAAQAPDFDRSGQGNLVRQREQNFHG
jgi:hypothetical protein